MCCYLRLRRREIKARLSNMFLAHSSKRSEEERKWISLDLKSKEEKRKGEEETNSGYQGWHGDQDVRIGRVVRVGVGPDMLFEIFTDWPESRSRDDRITYREVRKSEVRLIEITTGLLPLTIHLERTTAQESPYSTLLTLDPRFLLRNSVLDLATWSEKEEEEKGMERERIFFSFKTGNVVVIDFPVFAFLSISFFFFCSKKRFGW